MNNYYRAGQIAKYVNRPSLTDRIVSLTQSDTIKLFVWVAFTGVAFAAVVVYTYF